MVWDFDQENGGSGSRIPRISAAGFDIDTGKYYGPNPFDAVGFDPDTGRPIRAANPYQPLSAPGVPVQDPGSVGVSFPDGLRDAHPAAKVLWAVQNDLVPHLKGVPAMDEYGGIHPAYAQVVGETPSPTDSANERVLADGSPSSQKSIEGVPWYYPTPWAVEKGRNYADQYGIDISQMSDDQLIDCVNSIPKKDKDLFQERHEKLPKPGQPLTEGQYRDMEKLSQENRDMLKQYLKTPPCRPK